MYGFLIFLLVLALFVIFYLLFRGTGNNQKEQLCRKIETSTDIDYIIKFAIGGNYDLNGSHVSYTTISSHEDVKNTAKERLSQIAKETGNPDTLLRINSIIKLDESTVENAAKRMKPEDVIRKITPKFNLDDSILENAVRQVRDENILAEIAGNYSFSSSIRTGALDRITDRDLLYAAAINHPDDNLFADYLDEEQKSRFYEERDRIYKDRCRHGKHDWVIVSQETTHNEESDIRGYDEIRRCRICGRTEAIDHSDAFGSRTRILDPGKYDS